MKFIFYFLISFSAMLSAQDSIEATLVNTTPIEADKLVSITETSVYYIKDNVFYKTEAGKTISYSNLQLGALYTANAFNTLRPILFYKDFNSIKVLDNRFSEVHSIDFNMLKDAKQVSHASSGYDNSVWIFNTNTKQLELFDYKTNIVTAKTAPILNDVLSIRSDYNICYILTNTDLLVYNYSGRLINKISNSGFSDVTFHNDNIIVQKDNSLQFYDVNSNTFKAIELPKLLINRFFVTNQTLYIYSQGMLYQFQLKIK